MAWVRTALSILGLSALVARQSGSLFLAGAVLVVAAVAVAWLIADAERRHAPREGWPGAVAPGPVLLATTLSLLLIGAALAIVLT